MLEKCQGPECPRCGCQDTEEVFARGRWNGARLPRLVCKNCGFQWRKKKWATAQGNGDTAEAEPSEHAEPIPEGVVYHVIRCPNCNSDQTAITSTRRPIRHHKCKQCGNTFKSVEREG